MYTIAGANYFPRFETQMMKMKKSFLLDHSCKKLTVRKISMHRMRMCGRWSSPHSSRIPSPYSILFRCCLEPFLDAPISRVARARDFTTSRKVCSLFPALPMPHIFPASPFLSCHLIIVMKLAGNFSRNARPPVFLFHPLNVCGTRVSTASLANNRSWHFLRSHPTGSFHLIFCDIPTVCILIVIYVRAYNVPSVTLGRLEIETRAPLKINRKIMSRSLAEFRKFIHKREFADRSFLISSFSSLNSSSPSKNSMAANIA